MLNTSYFVLFCLILMHKVETQTSGELFVKHAYFYFFFYVYN